MSKIQWLLCIILFFQGVSYAQFDISDNWTLIQQQYKAWLSTPEAPVNELNLELKSKKEQEIYSKEKNNYIKNHNSPPYKPSFYYEWHITRSAPTNWYNFHLKSKEKQKEYANKVNRWFEEFNPSFLPFNLTTLTEPLLTEEELKKEEAHIKKLLIECGEIIGFESWENDVIEAIRKWDKGRKLNYDYYRDGPFQIQRYLLPNENTDMGFVMKANYHKLNNYAYKCVNYLYLHQGFKDKAIPEYYYINDFEYDRNLTLKEKTVENLYENIYLSIKKAGLLRRISNIYYPKSFLREHADKTGLTKFIQVQENKAGKKLKHEELAIQFFKTREKWLTSLNDYIENK